MMMDDDDAAAAAAATTTTTRYYYRPVDALQMTTDFISRAALRVYNYNAGERKEEGRNGISVVSISSAAILRILIHH